MAEVVVQEVSRFFGPTVALAEVSIRFADGGFYGLLGPSGSGKTTLLRLVAGFDFPDGGHISIAGEAMENRPVEKREIGMVFQNYALFPNMSVFDNVAFGLSVRGVARAEVGRRVGEALELVRLTGLDRRRPQQLSGGQRQRVALARALVTRPRVLLLDEPLSALDKALRSEMQIELKRIQRDVAITTIFVTHDQEEALTMSDRIGILNEGRLVQEGTPHEVYERPETVFTARFLGDANILSGRVSDDGIELADGTRIRSASPPGPLGGAVTCAVRAEKILLRTETAPEADGGNAITARVQRHVFAGNSLTYLVDWAGETLKVFVQNRSGEVITEGTAVRLSWAPRDTVVVTP